MTVGKRLNENTKATFNDRCLIRDQSTSICTGTLFVYRLVIRRKISDKSSVTSKPDRIDLASTDSSTNWLMCVSVWNVTRLHRPSSSMLKLLEFVELDEMIIFTFGVIDFSPTRIKWSTTKHSKIGGEGVLSLWDVIHSYTELKIPHPIHTLAKHFSTASLMLEGRLLSCFTLKLRLIIASPFRIWARGGIWGLVQLHLFRRPVYVAFQPFLICARYVAKGDFLIIPRPVSPP